MSPAGRGAAAWLLAALAAAAALAASALIAFYPPPSTFASLYPPKSEYVRDGRFAEPVCNGVQCRLCPYDCFLPEGARGRCKVRANYGGRIKTLVYGQAAAVHVDPIEKKPVYHMYPGSLIYSIATPGCNLSCRACQNWELSQRYPEQFPPETTVPYELRVEALPGGRLQAALATRRQAALSPEDAVNYALATRSRALAYTYSEPAVFYEYMYDTAKLARRRGLRNVMVSAGYINPEPLRELMPLLDVVKIDLKGFDEGFYRDYAGGRLEPVKRTLLELKNGKKLFEVVNLVVPGLNDGRRELEELSAWVKAELGADTPLFFSRFSPNYLLASLPQTPVETLTEARRIALKRGLRHVYVGNAPGHEGESTYCPKCGRALVRRYGYAVLEDRLTPTGGRCPWDGARVPGIWQGE